ncbi:RnfABCDGE type electron transport complex subunit D [Oscillatoria sp. CS-180]|uniref:RnfABCDGE type electron transport complex subunit D n=1 Tax=Oscillatoria sp. CS-180 TaxID=3021720 RepID=UPI002330CE8F|nr:RnfABCDGE type electron transport complex subunit D [Oscillatoria sp. CS-180]MDB9526470.1 RnfABCDGE type electron transport complex subunit D [Oscillatoria sp. CS-180]
METVSVLRDARDYQILFLSLFLVLGLATRDWTLKPEVVGVAIATSLTTQALFSAFHHRSKVTAEDSGELLLPTAIQAPQTTLPARFLEALANFKLNWRSPLISALGLSLLLRVDHLPTMALAAFVAIASKFCLKVNDKHFFNPANIGIIAALTLTHDAWVSPGQWGEELWYALIFLGAGGMVLKRVGRWDTTAAFLGSYALLEAGRNWYLGWTWDVWLHRLSSGSLLLFALFMVTDPRSIPNARPARLIWAISIAALTFILRNYFYLSTAVFWALFVMSPLTVVLDAVWESKRFTWKGLPSQSPTAS